MLGKNEIVYYLIEHPFKKEKTILFDRDKILETLNHFKEGMKIKRVLQVPQKEDGQIDKLLITEKSIVEDYEKSSETLNGWTIFSTFSGITLSYLLFKPLFILGYLPIINFLLRNLKSITPEVINVYADPGAQLAAIAIGMLLGFSPLILSGVASCNAVKRARKDKKRAELMKKLETCELEIVENESLASFYKDNMDLTGEIREKAEDLRKIKNRYNKIERCKTIINHLEKMITITKLHELNSINEYYHRLHNSFYDLEKRLKNPRFWRNDEKKMRRLLGDLR